MANFRIICTNQEPAGQPNDRAHIVAVGTGISPDKYDRYWSLNEVLSAMDQGHGFYTQGRNSGKVAVVQKYVCPNCTRTTSARRPTPCRTTTWTTCPTAPGKSGAGDDKLKPT